MRTRGDRVALFFMFFAFLLLPAFAQTPADVERLLDENAITFEQAAWFILAVAMDAPPDGPQEAFAAAAGNGWFAAGRQGADAITFADLSLLAMNAFDIKGGMMYRIFKNKRYAYREMKYRGYIIGRAFSNLAVSGEQFLQILGNVMDDREGGQ